MKTKTDKKIKKILNAWIGKGAVADRYMKRLAEELTEYSRAGKPEWIKIKDQLPENYKAVLCKNDKMTVVCWRAEDLDDCIYTIQGTDIIMENITHWMPLPASPVKRECEHPLHNRQKANRCGNCGEYLPKI